MGFEIVFLTEQLPKMICEDKFWSQEPIQSTNIGAQHRNP